MPPRRKATTTDKGLGWSHQQVVAGLLRKHIDGTPCWWCVLPMFKQPTGHHRNWDRKPLAGDHSIPRVRGGKLADRLLHGTCNSQRGDGRWDTERPALTSQHPGQWRAGRTPTPAAADNLVMDW